MVFVEYILHEVDYEVEVWGSLEKAENQPRIPTFETIKITNTNTYLAISSIL